MRDGPQGTDQRLKQRIFRVLLIFEWLRKLKTHGVD